MERPTPADMMPKKDHERDVELDKKIEALRRKNEALMRRHKEVEEDRKRAEKEGMALHSRKGKAEDLTITISKSTSESRVVVTKPLGGNSPAAKGQREPTGPDEVGDGPPQAAARGLRKQLTVTMAGKKGKRVVSERPEREPGPSDTKSPAHDGQVWRVEPPPVAARRGSAEQAEGLQASTDLDVPTSKEEQGEYVRWKKEREQIDRERVARHKNAKGQWKRAWDMDKTENMSLDKSLPDRGGAAVGRGGRSSRRGQTRAGREKRGRDEGVRDVPVMSSKAKGVDRLTGRARRWQEMEDGENLQSTDTTLEDFLEVLGALTDGEVDDQKDEEAKLKPSNSPTLAAASGEAMESTAAAQGDGRASSPPGAQRKVRFSKALVQGGNKEQTTGSQDRESRGVECFKAPSPKGQQHKVQRPQPLLERPREEDVSPRDQGGGPPAPPVARQRPSGSDGIEDDLSLPSAPRSPSAERARSSPERSSVQPASNTNAGELMDPGLSALVLDSGETNPTRSSSSDTVSVCETGRSIDVHMGEERYTGSTAGEHGKIFMTFSGCRN
ncbi:coiled-coil domain-containing protein 9B isoform 2-T2 [Spinachia spinachia]